MTNKTYDLNIEIWEDEDGSVCYSVIQNFSENVDDYEIVAYGEADSFEDAAREARNAVFTVME